MALHLELGLLLAVAAAAQPPADPLLPTPPRTTPQQAQRMEHIHAAAATASAAARPELLALLDDPRFRTTFAPLAGPAAAGLSAVELLSRFEEETAVAELVHNMPADAGVVPGPDGEPRRQPAPDNTIAIGQASPVFWNLWEIGLMTGASESPHFGPSVNCSQPQLASKLRCENNTDPHLAGGCKWVELEGRCAALSHGPFENPTNAAEVGLFGLPSFRGNAQSPADYQVSRHDIAGIWVAFFSRYQRYRCGQDAMQRPVYTAVNHHKVDLGNPNFGPVGVVFDREFNDNMTLLGAVDTGTRVDE